MTRVSRITEEHPNFANLLWKWFSDKGADRNSPPRSRQDELWWGCVLAPPWPRFQRLVLTRLRNIQISPTSVEVVQRRFAKRNSSPSSRQDGRWWRCIPAPWSSSHDLPRHKYATFFGKNQFLWALRPSWMLPDFLALVRKVRRTVLHTIKRKSRQKNEYFLKS